MIIVLLLFITLTNNIMFWRRGISTFPYKSELKFLIQPHIAYWLVHNSNHKGWVVLLHSFGGRSDYMVSRGCLFYNKGYSLLFVDGRSHGLSDYSLTTHSIAYAEDVVTILERELITNPIIYGVSYGAVACIELTKLIDIQAIILESCSATLKNIYWSILHYVHAPKYLFGWIPLIIFWHYRNFDWEKHDPVNLIKNVQVPLLIMHSRKDNVFLYNEHAPSLKKAIKNSNGFFWAVDGMLHTKIYLHKEWLGKVSFFIEKYVEK